MQCGLGANLLDNFERSSRLPLGSIEFNSSFLECLGIVAEAVDHVVKGYGQTADLVLSGRFDFEVQIAGIDFLGGIGQRRQRSGKPPDKQVTGGQSRNEDADGYSGYLQPQPVDPETIRFLGKANAQGAALAA